MSHTKYWSNHILLNLRLNPAPTNARELDFIFESFNRLGSIEMFKTPPPSVNYSQNVEMIISSDKSVLNPFETEKPGPEAKDKAIILRDFFARMVALPRFQYIENDESFFNGSKYVQFNHSLNNRGKMFENKFTISDSRINQPFCLIKSEQELDFRRLKHCLRFNFEKFTLIDIVSMRLMNNS
ncbi:hypothetical protein CLIB1444_04S02234 [[Candida] jaroonii]|uniref:Uncharacterized protein n=1 Tax=[Candida] jaroonii TaxID=467808 RepID=A0ACA9Y7B6_9ASCO|nr:hypothetical protein CLIB1444_04S02234 [[Candida] jaroonii]